MSSVETRKFEPATGTAVNLGASGDAVTLPAGVTLQTNTIKDAGGNTIFTSDGAGNLSSVNSGLQGNMVFISSVTASASSSIEFTSGIDSTYDEYVFYFVNLQPVTNATDIELNFSTDGGSSYAVTKTTTVFYAIHSESGGSGTLASSGIDLAQSGDPQKIMYSVGNSDQSGSGVLHLFAPSSTTYVKQFYTTTQFYRSDDNSQEFFIGGYCNTTSAVNAMKVYAQSGNINGSIYLYGIK